VCGELLIFDTNQQFATHRITQPFFSTSTWYAFAGQVTR